MKSLCELFSVIRKLVQYKESKVNVFEEDDIYGVFQNAEGILAKNFVNDSNNGFIIEPNWCEFEKMKYNLGDKMIVWIIDDLDTNVQELKEYLSKTKKDIISEVVFVNENKQSFDNETRKKVREYFKGMYLKCIFIQKENWDSYKISGDWRKILYETTCISKIS